MNSLHVWLVIDTSTSMRGDRAKGVYRGITQLMKSLQIKQKSGRYYDIRIHCVLFATQVEEITPDEGVPVEDFKLSAISTNGHSSLGMALYHVSKKLNDLNISEDQYIPLVVVVSDGFCTTSESFYLAVIQKFDTLPITKRVVRICLVVGSDEEWYDKDVLLQFCKEENHIVNMQNCAGIVSLIKEESILDNMLSEG